MKQADANLALQDATPADEGLRCPRCGYNLTGIPSGPCPECGEAFDAETLRGALVAGAGPIPLWDERGERGLGSAYLAAAATFVFRPRSFIANLPPYPSARSAWAFYYLNAALAGACCLAAFSYELWLGNAVQTAAWAMGAWLASSYVAIHLVSELLCAKPVAGASSSGDRRSLTVACFESVFLVPMGISILALAIAAEYRYRPAVNAASIALHLGWITWIVHTSCAAPRLSGHRESGVAVVLLMPLVAVAALLVGMAAVVVVAAAGFILVGLPLKLLTEWLNQSL